MKTKNLLTKTLLLVVALLGGVSQMWADNNPISIPQALGTYIDFGTTSGSKGDLGNGITLTNCQVDGGVKVGDNYYSIGSTNESSVATFKIYVTTAGDYLFNFKTGASFCSAKLNLTLTDDSKTEGDKGYTVWYKNDEEVVANRGWEMGSGHYFLITGLAVGNYTLKVSVKSGSKTGSYAGNWGKFAFNTADAFDAATWPTSSSKQSLTNNGTFGYYGGGASSDGTDVGSIRSKACAEYIIKNTSATNKYMLHVGMKFHNSGNLKVSITDINSGDVEVNQTYPINPYGSYDDFTYPITNTLTTGLKKFRLEFEESGTNSDGYIVNYKNVFFSTYTSLASEYQALPMKNNSTLDLSKWSTSANPRYQSEDENLGYIYNNNYAFFYVYNSNENAQYSINAYFDRNIANTRFKVTVTDVATGVDEVEGTTFNLGEENRNYTELMYTLPGTITSGLKLVRFDFLNPSDNVENTNWLYNIKNVSFYKRSLNENYDYTPVAAENVDVVLTRTINAGKWSTIVLPFAMTAEQVKATFGANVKLAQFTAYNNATKEVTMSAATAMNANEPYMIKVAENEYTSPVTIEGVSIVAATPATTISPITFQGVYESGKIKAGDYYVKNNQLFKATGTQTIKPFRAYFTGVPAEARLMFFDEETTSIANVDVKANDNFDANAPIFNLAGQRVGKNYKGVVIQNGKKYILK